MTTFARNHPPSRDLMLAVVAVVVAVVVAACGQSNPPPSLTAGPATAAPSPPAKTSAAPPPASSAAPAAESIPQPDPPTGLKIAPESTRVDIAMPVFSHPTDITNPLFPVSRQASVLMLGHVDDKPFRTEVTLLPFTRIVEWRGQQVETLVSQYAAYLDGRITEIAYDLYAQADDGSVWYFGEDVFDFVDGAIVTTEGTWLAGRDGPAAMIMPGDPKVGDAYRPENAPGFVFEEVTVQAVDRPLNGPLGPISGGLSISELHADGTTEQKFFAPGYGEFRTAGGGDLEALALAVPTDSVGGSVPPDLAALSDGALAAFDAIGAGNWADASQDITALRRAWAKARGGEVPAAVADVLDGNLRRLAAAIETRQPGRGRGAAIEVARSAYDLQLLRRPPTEIDLMRFDLWAAQILVDASAKDATGVNASVFALDYIRDRFIHTVDTGSASRLNTLLNDLQSAVIEDDLATAREGATGLRSLVASLQQ